MNKDYDPSGKKKRQDEFGSEDGSFGLKDAVIIVLVFALISGVMIWKTFPQTFISCEEDQPLLTIKKDFFPADTFQQLKQDLLAHPHTHSREHRAKRALPHTRGQVVMFNRDGVPEFREKAAAEEMGYLATFFDAVRHPAANAWVVNVLVIDPKPKANGVKVFGDIDEAVATHLDGNLAVDARQHTFLAHQTDVLYVSVPADMEGGALSVYPYASGGPRWKAWYKEQVKRPAENTLATFRGDAYHGVSAYYTDEEGARRVTLVLEQYAVPEAHYRRTVPYATDDYERRHASREAAAEL
mmetsp:Transcript_6635/g.11747  ORF Transcript_6635/g.11747 Transcript_6635/m.11747 type:complete len:298 (-) Transcript_6635:22-915(-)